MTKSSNYRNLLFGLIIIFACSSLQKWQPLDTDLVRVQKTHPDLRIQDLIKGYKLYIEKCSACHSLHHPTEFSAIQWDTILPRMFNQAKMNKLPEKLLIEHYLYSKIEAIQVKK